MSPILLALGIGAAITTARLVMTKAGTHGRKINVFNLSGRVVKQKRYQSTINDRTKGGF